MNRLVQKFLYVFFFAIFVFNRTVSLLISGHIHDIEIQCEQQNVIYKGLGIFFSSKYKAVIQIWYVGLLSFISQRSVNR